MTIPTNTSPGEFIRTLMNNHGWTQDDLAQVMSVSLKTINKVIQNKQSITMEMAHMFANAFPGEFEPIELFIKSTTYFYESDQNRLLTSDNEISLKAAIYKFLPVSELVKRKWLTKTTDIDILRNDVEKFLDILISDESDLEDFFNNEKKVYSTNFRKSEAHQQFNQYAAETWCLMAEKAARFYQDEIPYSSINLRTLYETLHVYTTADDGVERFLYDLNSTGVKFMVLPHLQKTYIDGAALLVDSFPVIVYTGRYKRLDNFWFTIAHEIGHVLNHLTADVRFILDDIKNGESSQDSKEIEADNLARTYLRINEIIAFFQNTLNYITVEKVEECSQKLNIHKTIIIGALAFQKSLSYKHIHLFNEDIINKIPEKYFVENFIN